MSVPTLVTFVVYFVLLLGIGFYFYRKSVSIEDYLLGGRGMGAWVTALSAQASDMSGWLLMGLPGAIYLAGMHKAWIAIGLFIGTVLNWKLVSARLRLYTQKTDSITLPSFFEQRFGDPTGLLRTVSAIIILIFFTIYASSGLVATGKLFESIFDNVTYKQAVIVGGGIIIAYTFLGGFLAVCWTDLFQGMLMLVAVIVVPAIAYHSVGGAAVIKQAMADKQISLSLIPQTKASSALIIISAMAWGLGYFGQPHILARFMSAKSARKLTESTQIAIVWVFLSLAGAVVVGLIAIPMFDNLTDGDEEKVFIYMIAQVMHPWIAGIMLAAILSAIMSTIDSQLLVSSSALTEDFYQKAIKKDASEKQIMLVGRICVIIISIIALVLALNPSDTILRIVAYAWGGFGAAFGPLVLFALFSRRTTWQAALAGMLTGTVVLILWKQVGLSKHIYEIFPGFVCNCLTIFVVNAFIRQRDEKVLTQYTQVVEQARAGQ
ncbi:MAG: sodium/proline symporter PutP [Planctomycetota bacterium]